jgi:hypothetical protein
VPSFCRHNRFVERCPICSATLPDHLAPAKRSARGAAADSRSQTRSSGGAKPRAGRSARRSSTRRGGEDLRVRREERSREDGYGNELVPGLRASADAERLAAEISFAGGRLAGLEQEPPGLYGEIRELARTGELERASWVCFLAVYLSPLQDEDPFQGIRVALAQGQTPALDDVPLGPRSSHTPGRGAETLLAYRQWVARAGLSAGGVPRAFVGEETWTAERRFERIFERLALPGFGRMGRYELLVTLGRLGLYPLRAPSLELVAAHGGLGEDLTALAAKRVFGIGEPVLMERRALVFTQAAQIPLDVLELALANWAAPARATLGFPADTEDADIRGRAREALGL